MSVFITAEKRPISTTLLDSTFRFVELDMPRNCPQRNASTLGNDHISFEIVTLSAAILFESHSKDGLRRLRRYASKIGAFEDARRLLRVPIRLTINWLGKSDVLTLSALVAVATPLYRP